MNQAFAQSTAIKVGVKSGIFEGIMQANLVVQLLLLIMISVSIISWALVIWKYRELQAYERSNSKFSEFFWTAHSLEAIFQKLTDYPKSNLARIFRVTYMELQKLAESELTRSGQSESQKLVGLDNLERTVRKAIDAELTIVESRLNFLATTGSTSPFIGLLGTVIGIMSSFSRIAATGSASLAVVAPGISEALFSTAVGLFAAIPAVVAYNYFIAQIRRIEMNLNSFGADFLNVTKRNFFREG